MMEEMLFLAAAAGGAALLGGYWLGRAHGAARRAKGEAAHGGDAPLGRQPPGAGRLPEEERRYETLLANIDAYDGTPRGQRPL